MKFLKGLALSLLGLLLFLSLTILGLAFMVSNTVLNPDFVVKELDKLGVYSLAGESLGMPKASSQEPYISKVVEDTLVELAPWLEEQVNTVIYAGYDYLLGKSQSLNVNLSLEPVRAKLKQNLRAAVSQSPPPELRGAPPGAEELYLQEAYRRVDQEVPPSFSVSQRTLEPRVVAQLEQMREVIAYVQLGYKVLIGFVLLLVLLIILIHREVRGATRGLGITFLACGVATYLSNWGLKYFVQIQIVSPSPQWQQWLPQLVPDILAPLDMYSIGLGVGGVVLLIISFVYKRG